MLMALIKCSEGVYTSLKQNTIVVVFNILNSVCCQLAEQAANQRNFENAIRFYKDALVYNENDTKVCL